MLRRWVLAGAAIIVSLSGCATDDRRAQIDVTLAQLDETKTKVKKIKEEVISATERIGVDKKLNLSKAIAECENLKDFCSKQVQKQALVVQTLRKPLTDAEKEQYSKEFKSRINEKIDTLDKETLLLDDAIKKLEKAVDNAIESRAILAEGDQNDAKKAVEDLKKKLQETQAEFESINRKT